MKNHLKDIGIVGWELDIVCAIKLINIKTRE